MREEQVLNYLETSCRGKRSAQKGAQLERALGISRKTLQDSVNQLRCKSYPIGSSRNGYFYAVTADEIYTTIGHLQKMEYGLRAIIRGLERSLEKFSGGD